MTEADASAVLLVRAFESPITAPWSDADAAWATREAQRNEGESAPAAHFLAQRARLACRRLAERGLAFARTLPPFAAPTWLGMVLVPGAFALGLAGDSIGTTHRINILAPPLLALLAWNLCVYLVLAVATLRHARSHAAPAASEGLFRRGLVRLSERIAAWSWPRPTDASTPAVARFVIDWAGASRMLQGTRIASVLHAAAAAMALGALCSMYARGLVFAYRAGWDSTFLSVGAVQQVLSFVLGPAALLSGIALPDAEALARIRFSAGEGESAARWIHLYALTIGLVVLLPRIALSVAAKWRASRAAANFALPLDDAYFHRLLQAQSTQPIVARVLPYSYHLPGAALTSLRTALEQRFGPRVVMRVCEPVALGAEDDADGLRAAAAPPPADSSFVRVALFPLTATPERENHGAFVRALGRLAPHDGALVVMVDESTFRQRFTGSDGDARLVQRRDAWRRMLQDLGVVPEFVDLSGRHGA
jgi:hypothetical protein